MIPREVCPEPTAVSACSICTSLPDGLQGTKLVRSAAHARERERESRDLKVVREKEYWLSPMAD